MPLQSVNYKQKLFVIPCGGGVTCLGFDVCMDRSLALACEFSAMHNSNPEVFKEASPFLCEYGTPAAYAEYERLCAIGAKLNAKTHWRSKVCLTPQLIGLECYRVEVVDCYGETRRFQVGTSTGWMPCHIELYNRRSHGGGSVTGAPFKSVRKVYRKDGQWYISGIMMDCNLFR